MSDRVIFTADRVATAMGGMTQPVSRETLSRLEIFDDHLVAWSGHTNLVARSTLGDRWRRHYADSLQLYPLFPKKVEHVLDLGSGAGFPGMVLAIMLAELQPQATITLVDSTAKKTRFLSEIIEKTSLTQTFVEAVRIEQFKPRHRADLVTARALSPLPKLLELVHPLMAKRARCLFLKGKRYREELMEAKCLWQLQAIPHNSRTDPEAAILEITDLHPQGHLRRQGKAKNRHNQKKEARIDQGQG